MLYGDGAVTHYFSPPQAGLRMSRMSRLPKASAVEDNKKIQ